MAVSDKGEIEMTLDEVFDEEPMISKVEAMREVRRHGLDWADFIAEAGDKAEYNGREILEWLGY